MTPGVHAAETMKLDQLKLLLSKVPFATSHRPTATAAGKAKGATRAAAAAVWCVSSALCTEGESDCVCGEREEEEIEKERHADHQQ